LKKCRKGNSTEYTRGTKTGGGSGDSSQDYLGYSAEERGEVETAGNYGGGESEMGIRGASSLISTRSDKMETLGWQTSRLSNRKKLGSRNGRGRHYKRF